MNKFKTFEDNQNGKVMNIPEDVLPIGMHEQESCPYAPFSMDEKMRRGSQAQIFNNNGGTSKADGGGTINKNGEYGPVTYGF